MKLTQAGAFLLGRPEDKALSLEEQTRFASMNQEETQEELEELLREAPALADPVVLFGICGIQEGPGQSVRVNGVEVSSGLVREKLGGRNRCFPFIATCGTALARWAEKYRGDFLTEFWADEIQKLYLNRVTSAFFPYLKEQYCTKGHLTSLNPGSLQDWPLEGQRELFQILGGPDQVKELIGVEYTESFLMLPFKSVSGIAFESGAFYENCQYCPLDGCPNRRAARLLEEPPCTG